MLILKFTAALFSNSSKEHPLMGFICSFYISYWWGPNLKLALQFDNSDYTTFHLIVLKNCLSHRNKNLYTVSERISFSFLNNYTHTPLILNRNVTKMTPLRPVLFNLFLLTMNVPLFQLISVRGDGQGQMGIKHFPEQGLLILIFESLTGSLEAVLLKPNNNFNPPNCQQLTLVPFSSIHTTSSAGDFIYFWSSEHLCPAAMEVNRDQAERCIDIATAALSNDQPEKAQRFLKKAQRLFPTAKAKGELK